MAVLMMLFSIGDGLNQSLDTSETVSARLWRVTPAPLPVVSAA